MNLLKAVLITSLLFFMASCDKAPVTGPESSGNLPTVSLTLPDTVEKGESFSIAWSSSDADSLSSNFAVGMALSGNVNLSVNTLGSKKFVVRGYNSFGMATDSGTVMVVESGDTSQPVDPPTVSLNAPDSVNSGSTASVSWTTSGADSVKSNFQGSMNLSGQVSLSFNDVGVDTLIVTAYNAGGHSSDTAYVVVVESGELPTITLTATATTIEVGGSVTLEWNSDGADSLYASFMALEPDPSGSVVFSADEVGVDTFYVSAFNDVGSASDTLVINVVEAQALPRISFSAPDTVKSGETFLVLWISWDADSVTSNFADNMVLGSTKNISITEIGTVALVVTAYNSVGTATDTAFVVVEPAGIEVQVDKRLSTNSDSLFAGGAADVNIPREGLYRISVEVEYDISEKNESFFVQVRNVTDFSNITTVTPIDPNLAGLYKIVVDEGNINGNLTRDAGTFRLSVGRNLVDVYHYFQISGNHDDFVDNSNLDGSFRVVSIRLEWVGP